MTIAPGALGTAQLLMLSGIGPQGHLREIGIEPVLDLPGVGANLHDHFLIPVNYRAAQPIAPSRGNHFEVIGLSRSDPGLDAPDIEIFFGNIPYGPGITDPAYCIMVSVVRPRSRGTLRLANAWPSTPPVADPNYLGEAGDLDTIITALRKARDIGRATALDPWREAEIMPGPEVEDDADLAAYVRRSLTSFFHQVGTCRMGQDETAVVGMDLRVHGIDGLRVADASVMPTIPCGHPNATVYAIAERASDLIRP